MPGVLSELVPHPLNMDGGRSFFAIEYVSIFEVQFLLIILIERPSAEPHLGESLALSKQLPP